MVVQTVEDSEIENLVRYDYPNHFLLILPLLVNPELSSIAEGVHLLILSAITKRAIEKQTSVCLQHLNTDPNIMSN